MLTKDDLEQFGKVIDKKLEAEREQTKKLVEASEKRVKRQIKKTESVFVRFFDSRVGDAEKRIRHIEDRLDLTHTN
jgi:hypothetical protein